MKREILFRVWDIVEKCYLPEDVYCILNRTKFRAFGQMIKDWRDYKEGEYFYDGSQTLEQFTGLTDKNGVKIFEGDIVKSDWGYGFVPRIVDMEEFYYAKLECTLSGEIEVIGNIYENPELLK